MQMLAFVRTTLSKCYPSCGMRAWCFCVYYFFPRLSDFTRQLIAHIPNGLNRSVSLLGKSISTSARTMLSWPRTASALLSHQVFIHCHNPVLFVKQKNARIACVYRKWDRWLLDYFITLTFQILRFIFTIIIRFSFFAQNTLNTIAENHQKWALLSLRAHFGILHHAITVVRLMCTMRG